MKTHLGMLRRPSVLVYQYEEERRGVLIVRTKKQHLWVLPGGKPDSPYELPEDTALRETREETGLKAGELALYGVFDGIAATTLQPMRMIVYEAGIVAGNLAAGREVGDVGLLHPGNCEEYMLASVLERELLPRLSRERRIY
jgi:8-oxo-dGTP pyrophosphatase MutT (NUDIX family)